LVKKRLSTVLIFALILSIVTVLAACGNNSNNGGNKMSEGNGGDKGGSGKTYTLKLSHNVPEDTAIHRAALAFKDEVEKNSNGQIKVEIYPNLQLGAMREQAEQVQFGSSQMTVQGTSVLTPFNEEIQVLDLPFLWPSDEKMWEVLQGPVGDEILASFEGTGFKGMAIWAIGFKQITNNDGPINGPTDLKGKKIRVMPSPLLVKQYESWGASPTPIDLGELYTALQQGVVSGQDNGYETIYTQKIHEVQKYMTISNHNMLNYMFVANEKWFNDLPKDLQDVVSKAAKSSAQVHFDLRVAEEAELLQKIKDSGVQVNELSAEGQKAFIEASKPVYDEFLKTDFQKSIYNKIQEAIK